MWEAEGNLGGTLRFLGEPQGSGGGGILGRHTQRSGRALGVPTRLEHHRLRHLLPVDVGLSPLARLQGHHNFTRGQQGEGESPPG